GNSIWFQKKGFAIRSGSEWQKVYTFASPSRVATAIAYSGDTAIAAWCGPCNNAGFTRGVVVGHYNSTTSVWTWTASALTGVPTRFIAGVTVDATGTLYLAVNGFSRRFTEGPGAGIGHIFKSTDAGATWTDISTTTTGFPDVPTNSIKVLASGALVVGTDLGVVYKPAASTTWKRLASNFPATVVMDVEVGPDGYIYAATHGRGIWRISASGL
ncbi:MAG: glycosyl hydrolase, partial [Chloroflexota bacterium]